MLALGDQPPDFSLPDHDGQPVTWSSLRGRPVALFFYPKADTPGCTQESCDFRDRSPDFAALGVALFGVSADTVKKQRSFATKHGLTMPLLSDPERVILDPWGIWGQKSMYGRSYEGIKRTTVLFDAEGRVAQVWSDVKVKGHADEVLKAARALVNG